MKTETLCHFKQDNYNLKLIKETSVFKDYAGISNIKIIYRVTLNRKNQGKSLYEYSMRKLFSLICQNIVLQLKIY